MRQNAKITPEGTRDLLFEDCAARDAAQRTLGGVFEQYGYAPVATPHLEFTDVFRGAGAELLAGQSYSVTDSQGRLLVLRPDTTLPIARVAATRLLHAPLPLRLYYHQSVFRRSRFYSGHSDETLQSGVELLGAGGLRADLEILSCAAEALQACGAQTLRVELGHSAVFQSLAEELGAGEELREALAEAIETKNLPALTELLRPCGPGKAALLELPRLFGGPEVLRRAKALTKRPQVHAALEELTRLYEALTELGLHNCVEIDLGLVHGQQYYTGAVFRGYIAGSGRTVLSGGRYDNLLAEFGRPAQACGFAIELEPLAEALRETAPRPAPPQVMVYGAPGREAMALARAKELRTQGVHCVCAVCETEAEARAQADARGIARVEILGN